MQPRILAVFALVLLFPALLHAGGPAWVAGAGYNPGVEGQPILWTNATVEYFTDQGALSSILNNSQADAFVTTAITPWTTAAGVGLTVTQGGHLAEDVNGSNIEATNGVISAPADVTSTAIGTPLGIIYDYDGTVTDAILGEGAGALDDCFYNAVYGAPDNFSASGNIVHAVAIINGVCASTSTQLPDVQYRLVRVLGSIFGLAWSQANDNVLTGDPPPGAADYAGFPVMHFLDPIDCVPITLCYPNPAVPKMDDVTALARLYPAPGGNPLATGRIWGDVYFTNAAGSPEQQMQGVNVVARLIDSTGNPSRQYVVTSVSGFEFVGNAGNIVTGYDAPNGLPFNRFGSDNASVEGFYDLGELTIPSGQNIAEYQISVEAIDPNWSWGVQPYGPTQVAPSGSFAPVVVTIQSGSNVERDISMLGSEVAETHPGSGSTYINPAPLPQGGGWASWTSGYGSSDFFEFSVKANRTASVAVTALDETGAPTESKLQPVIGIWELNDETGDPAPAATPSAFNSLTFGISRLDAQFGASEAYKVGIVDYRGDGRPDYAYQASLLYSDSMTPARLSVAGGVTTLTGIGFIPGLGVDNGANSGVVLMQSATQLQISLPAATVDGIATVEVTSPATGSFSQMQGALTYGAAANDLLMLLNGGSQTAPLGAQAPSMIRVRATASDGVTPVNGATIAWSATNGVELSACNAAASCSVLTDGSGEAATWVTPTAFGQGTISAALAPAAYQPPQTQLATLQGTESSLDLAAVAPTRWLAQGVTLNVPLTVEALDMDVPQANVNIKFTVTNGTASLSSSTATTNSMGLASITAQLTNLAGTVQVSACVSPAETPCQTFTVLAVPSASWTLEAVSGALQIVPNGLPFQTLVMRVTDGSANDDPVQGVSVTFLTTLERNPQGSGGGPPQGDADRRQKGAQGEGTQQNRAQQDDSPVILGTSQSQAATDQNGLASITPTVGSLGPCDAFITVTAGLATAQYELENVDPLTSNSPQPVRQAASPSVRFVPLFNVPPTASQNAPPELVAFPEGIPAPAQDPPPDDASPAADSNSISNSDDGNSASSSSSISPSGEDAQPKPSSATGADPQTPALPNSPSTDNPKTASPTLSNQPPATPPAAPH
ncbi:MAG: Ig-like domain-containing protein [Terriglobales bacterium]